MAPIPECRSRNGEWNGHISTLVDLDLLLEIIIKTYGSHGYKRIRDIHFEAWMREVSAPVVSSFAESATMPPMSDLAR